MTLLARKRGRLSQNTMTARESILKKKTIGGVKRITLCFAFIFFAAYNIVSKAESDAIPNTLASALTHEYKLDNGLKLIVRENHRAPVAIFQIWYKVGSADESVYQTGLSHVLEHMMFKGTSRVPPGVSSKIIAEYGGEENAFTTHDYTAYYQYWNASRLPISFELEADRMRGLIFPKEEFIKEMQVVMEERRMRVEDNPTGTAYERFMAVANTANPQRNPVIGWMHDLEKLTIEEAKNWYNLWYAPNNATIVIIGDVDPEESFELAKKYFGPIPSKVLPRREPLKEVISLGERRLQIKVPVRLSNLYMGFNVPSLTTTKEEWEPYALEMLVSVLDGGFSARMEKELIRDKKIAASIGTSYSAFERGDSLLLISALPNTPNTLATLENAIWEMLEKLKTDPISAVEIERVKAQLISEHIYQMDSIASQATEIGSLESLGLDWRLSETTLEKIKMITPEQIQKVAQTYLTKDRLTVAEVIPVEFKIQEVPQNMNGENKTAPAPITAEANENAE